MAEPIPFWLVWSPTGARPPRYQHGSMEEAAAEAKRLAHSAPGHAFFVVAPSYRFEVPTPDLRVSIYYDAQADDEVPF